MVLIYFMFSNLGNALKSIFGGKLIKKIDQR